MRYWLTIPIVLAGWLGFNRAAMADDTVFVFWGRSVIRPRKGDVAGRLKVPPAALIKGANTFEFTFADNLSGQTGGYEVHHASLLVVCK